MAGGTDATLVQSMCGKFDGATTATTSTGVIVHSPYSLDINITFRFYSDNLGGTLVASGNSSGDRNFILYKVTSASNTIRLYLYDDAGNMLTYDIADTIKDTWYNWNIKYDGVNIITTDNETGNILSTYARTDEIRILPDTLFAIGSTTDSNAKYTGDIVNVKVGETLYPLAEGAGSTLYGIHDNPLMQNYGVFDGATYALINNTDFVQSSTRIDFEFVFMPKNISASAIQGIFGQTFVTAGNYSFYVRINTAGNITVNASEDGSTFAVADFAVGVEDYKTYTVIGSYSPSGITLNVNGVDYTPSMTGTAPTSLHYSGAKVSIGCPDEDGHYPFVGDIMYLKVGLTEFKFDSDTGTTTVVNSGVGDDATLSGATLSTFWANDNATLSGATLSDFWSDRQDTLHYNILNGFSEYNDDNDIVRVPKDIRGDVDLVQVGTTDYLDENPSIELTQNPTLNWTGTEIDEFTKVVSGTGSITEVSNGTRVYADGSDAAYISGTASIESGKTYNYYVYIESKTGADPYIVIGNQIIYLTSVGINTGSTTTTGTGTIKYSKNSGSTSDTVVSEFYVWEHSTMPLLDVTNPAGRWHNDAETGIQLPSVYQSIQDDVPITSITKNARLEWADGEIPNINIYEYGTSTVTEVANGTRLYAPDGDLVIIDYTINIENGKTYNYYIYIESLSGELAVSISSDSDVLSTVGAHSGSLTATADYTRALIKRSAAGVAADGVVSRFYLWEAGTIPPLFYDEFETNFNDKNMVFANMEDKKHRSIVLYDTAKTADEVTKILKCFKKGHNDVFTYDSNGDVIVDSNGYPVTTN